MTKITLFMALKLGQLYLNGDRNHPSMEAAVDSKGRWLHYSAKDQRISIGKLIREPRTVEGSNALAERCRKRTGLQTISWYSWSRDVIEIPATEIERVDDVYAAYAAEGYPIELIQY
jgi:hypothetical protein